MHAGNQMFYDYWWGQAGFPWLPTAAQIRAEFPNPAGWGTGMENCALSAAQVLPGALLRHSLAPDDRTLLDVETLLAGLLRLFDVAGDPGFLPRGVALDGHSHYMNSSADQYTMVLYALHAYSAHSVATAARRQQIQHIWHNVLLRWERHGWEDRREDGAPAMYGDMHRIAPDRSSRLLAALLGGFAVTGERHWHDVYRHKLEEQERARLRVDVPAATGALYVLDQNQVAWRLLWELETEPEIRRRYEELLYATAEAVTDRLPAYRQFDAAEHSRRLAVSDWDWNKACLPAATAPNQGADYNRRLRHQAPVIDYEHTFVQAPWEAAHILALSTDAGHARMVQAHLPRLLASFPWDQLALSWSFYDVEWTWWLSRQASSAASRGTST